jgi:hypothetical protein
VFLGLFELDTHHNQVVWEHGMEIVEIEDLPFTSSQFAVWNNASTAQP